MARLVGGVALASIALMALCCVVVLHVNEDHAIKMDVYHKEGNTEGHDVYDSDMVNLMELLQETRNEDDLTGEEKALINAAGRNDDAAAGRSEGEPMLHWSEVEDHEESMGEPEDHHDHHPHSKVHSKAEEDQKDSLSNEDKALITAANGRTLSLTPKKKAVRKLAKMKHTSYVTPKARKHAVEQRHRPLVQQEMPKAKAKGDPRDELNNEDKALLAAADGPKRQEDQIVSEAPVEQHESQDPRDQLSREDKALLAAADGLEGVKKHSGLKRKAHRVAKPHKVAKKHVVKKVVRKMKVVKKAKKVKMAPKKAPVHTFHERSSGKNGLSKQEKALLEAADAGEAKHSKHKAQKQIRKMMKKAKKAKKVKKMKVVHHVAPKKALRKHNKAKLVTKKQPRKAVKLPSTKNLRTEVKADNLETVRGFGARKAKKKPAHKAPVLPKAMRRAMEKITKKATKQALATATKDSFHRATEDVAAHAVDEQTHVGLHGASKAVKKHLAHLKKVSRANEKKAKNIARKKALKRKQKLHRVSVNLAARAIVLNKHTSADDALAAKDTKLAKIKEKIRALKAQEVTSASDEWAKMKAKADKEALSDANAATGKHQMTAKEMADAAAMQAKLERQTHH